MMKTASTVLMTALIDWLISLFSDCPMGCTARALAAANQAMTHCAFPARIRL
jgi:hypothetical protein